MYNVAVDFAPHEGLTVADKENQTMWQNSQSETITDPIILAELALQQSNNTRSEPEVRICCFGKAVVGPKKS